MKKIENYIDTVGQIIAEIEKLGLSPVLVGGMALVILGSPRVTKDFDFLISKESLDYAELLKIFYKKGFELASKLDQQRNILTTIEDQNVAAIRIKLDSPESIYFLNLKTGLRIDLLLDFPLPANELASRAEIKKIRSYFFRIASREDILKLKEIAYKDRAFASDAADLEFLRKTPKPS
jgi:hypothetical protein